MAKVAKNSGQRGGSKPGERRGGRQKGTPNVKTREATEILKANGFDPYAGLLYWARVLRSATAPRAAEGKPETAEIFYQGVVAVSDGEDGSHLEPVWARASDAMANAAATQLTQYILPKRSAVRVDFRKPHDMTDDELDAAIRQAFKGGA